MRPARDPTESALSRTVHRVVLGFILLACLVLLILGRIDSPRVQSMRMALADLLLPSMEWVATPVQYGTEILRDYENFFDVYAQNRDLRREVQRNQAWRERARQLEEENAQLRALNNVRLAPQTTFVTGDVISDGGGPFSQTALVNVGARDGVRDGSAAVDGNGLVGRVVGVGERAARILLLTDFSSRVPVIVQPAGSRAILTGDGTTAPKLQFLDSTERVQPGNLIETSGDGGVFPPDLPVGRLISLGGQGWRVVLAANYTRLEFVRLLRYTPDTEIDQPAGLILPGLEQSAADLLAPLDPIGEEVVQ